MLKGICLEFIGDDLWKVLNFFKTFFFFEKKHQGVSLAIFFQKKKKVFKKFKNLHEPSLMNSKLIPFSI